ncbi:hypothetical protein X737_34400 [Mesorhizobium sp. L48C026A00]|nr:hypothetical protein X737_34400 [Mesorhizobium sp. L48C026A00]
MASAFGRVPGYWFSKRDFNRESFAFVLHNANAQDQKFPRKIGAGAWFENWAAPRHEITEQSFRIQLSWGRVRQIPVDVEHARRQRKPQQAQKLRSAIALR